jgi:cobalt-zinc-cadmium resistance protein CzcA
MNRTQQTKVVLARIKAEVEKINSDGTLPPGVKVVPFYDRGWLVATTTDTVLHNVIFGFLLVFFIQWIFLGNLRSAFAVGINIPFALFFAVIIMVLRGEDANLLSIGAIDFGIIVDSAVILVENIFRNSQLKQEDRKRLLEELSEGQFGSDPTKMSRAWTSRLRVIYISAIQVDKAIYFSTMVTVAAFIPLFTMKGVEGQIFGPMARTYGYALAGALLATFTITPVLASILLPEQIVETETIVVRALRAVYTPILRWALGYRKTTVTLGLMFLAIVGFLVPRLGTEFLPPLEEGNLDIHMAMPPTISLEGAAPTVTMVREVLLRHPEVDTVISQQGRPDNGSDNGGFGDCELFVFLKPFDQWPSGMTKEKLVQQLQTEFSNEFTGITFDFSQYIQTNVEEAMSGVKGGENSVKIIGPDLAVLERLADQIRQEVAQVKGVEDLGILRVLGQPNLDVKVNREKAARYGLNAGDLNTIVQTAMGGATATTVLEADRQFNLAVRLAPEYRKSIDEVRSIKVAYQTPGGANAYIPLSELADISLDTGATYIYHERNLRYIPIKFSVRGRDLGSTVQEAQKRIAQNVTLPTGYRIEWAGEFGELQEAIKRLEFIVPITLVLIMVLLYSLFNSLRDSLLVLAGIPFAIAGGILSLFVSGLDFSISAAVGFVSLFGVSVMNNILILTYYNQTRLANTTMDRNEAMFHAGEQRMRPMLMTALSACIGLLPAALSHGIGSQVQRPLAAVVVGGMLIGPVILLVVVPALRMMFKKKQEGSLQD